MLANDIHAAEKMLARPRATHEMTNGASDFHDTSEIENFIGLRGKFCHELHLLLEMDGLAADTVDTRREVSPADKAVAQTEGRVMSVTSAPTPAPEAGSFSVGWFVPIMVEYLRKTQPPWPSDFPNPNP